MSDTSTTSHAPPALSKLHAPPALSKFMHHRNPYRTPPSFKQLAMLYPNFRSFCSCDITGKVRLDFTQPQALAELAIALMHKDFGLMVTLPSLHLVPTIPLRLNYLLWLQDLVGLWAKRHKDENEFDLKKEMQLQEQQKQQFMADQTQQSHTEVQGQHSATGSTATDQQKEHSLPFGKQKPEYINPVVGLDIGCGASCVYGLLGARHCGWHMVATDTDCTSLRAAAHNVAANNLTGAVHVAEGSSSSLFSVLETEAVLRYLACVRGAGRDTAAGEEEAMETDSPPAAPRDEDGYLLDFSMCNPPFFSSEQDTDSCAKTKRQRPAPNNAYTGTPQETVIDGGEIAFITKMIQESVLYKDKVRVFSTLVGTAADVKKVKQLVAAAGPVHTTVTEFCQGRTMRWGVAWTWCPSVRLSCVQSKKKSSTAKPLLLPWPRISCLPVYTVTAAWEAMAGWLADIKLKPKVFKKSKYFVGVSLKAYKVTWQNQRQRRREEKRKANENAASPGGSLCSEVESCTSPDTQTTPCTDSSPAELGAQCSGASLIPDPVTQECKRKLGTEEELVPGINDTPKRPRLEDCVDSNDETDSEEEEEDDNCVDGNSDTNGTKAQSNGRPTNGAALSKPVSNKPKQTGKPCLLRVNIFVKLVNNQLLVEMHVIGGLLGKDGANQLLTYFRNKYQKRK